MLCGAGGTVCDTLQKKRNGVFMAVPSNINQDAQFTSSDFSTRHLPQDIEAEKSVLAACLLDQTARVDILPLLHAKYFYSQSHAIIFQAIFDMDQSNTPLDTISLADHLRAEGTLSKIGGREYLLELADNTFAITNWQHHAHIVKRTAILRELIMACTKISAYAYNTPDNLNEVVEVCEKTLLDVTEQKVSSSFKNISTLLSEAFEQLTEQSKEKNAIVGVPSGFADIDKLFHGFRGGDLIILAARPGVGKTSFALNIATNAVKAGFPVIFFSLEMSDVQLVQRIMCSEAQVSLSKVRSGDVGAHDWSALLEAVNRLSETKLYIDDTPGLSILEARAKARRQFRNINKQGLIIVDYLQLMNPSSNRRDSNRAVEVAEISRGLKILAKEMDMPVLALSQLSRAVEQRQHKRPQLSDLRESGSIEQDADIVMFIDRSTNDLEAEEESRPRKGTAELIVAKHRNGPQRDITLAFNAEFTRFGNFISDDAYHE